MASFIRGAAALMVLKGFSVCAQPLMETVETGSVGSAWSRQNVTAGGTIGPSMQAAHRGQYGVRLSDTETVLDMTAGPLYSAPLDVPSTVIYVRGWVREVSANTLGGTNIIGVTWAQGSKWEGAGGFGINYAQELSGGEQGIDSAGGDHYQNTLLGVHIEDGGWHLLESSTTGRGGDAGVVSFAVDGQVLHRDTGVQAFADRFVKIDFGEVYAYNTGYEVTLDFDDLGVDVLPLASRFSLEPTGPVVAGNCYGLKVALAATFALPDGGDPGAIAAPYPVKVAIDGAGALFDDDGCQSSASDAFLDAGSRGRVFFARAPDGGTLQLSVRQDDGAIDFIGFALPVGVAPRDGGAGGGAGGGGGGSGGGNAADGGADASYYAMHCAVTPGSSVALLLLLSWWRKRRLT